MDFSTLKKPSAWIPIAMSLRGGVHTAQAGGRITGSYAANINPSVTSGSNGCTGSVTGTFDMIRVGF